MRKLLFIFPIVALLATACNFSQQTNVPSTAPPGKETKNINPNDFNSVTLKDSPSYLVKSKGEIKIKVQVGINQRVWMTIDKANLPSGIDNSGLIYYAIYPNGTYNVPSNNKLEPISGDNYFFKFYAPSLPGNYKLVFSEPLRKEYQVTVVSSVPDKETAIKIVERYMFSQLGSVQEWHKDNETASLEGENWKVKLKISYKTCGIDWESDICSKHAIDGSYTVNKNSGLIIQ